MPTEAALQAMSILRDPSHFQWYVIALFAFVVYVYAVEIERRNWNGVLAGLTFFLTDVLWEIGNALVLHGTNHSALWVVSGGTSFLLLVGLSIEISMMFAIAGIVFTKLLPADRKQLLFGIPNRWFYIAVNSIFCGLAECLLVQTPYFHWGYSWWNFPLVVLIGYAPFDWLCFKVFDSRRKVQLRIVASLATLDAALLVVFGWLLHWI